MFFYMKHFFTQYVNNIETKLNVDFEFEMNFNTTNLNSLPLLPNFNFFSLPCIFLHLIYAFNSLQFVNDVSEFEV